MSEPYLPRERVILALTVAAHAVTHVAEQAFPAVALLVMADFFGTAEAYGAIGDANFFAALLFGSAALPSGRLVDRLGSRRVLLIMLGGTGLSLFGMALASEYRVFTAALAALGFFSGLYHPAGTTMISIGIRRHGRAMGAHGMGGTLGLAVTPALAAGLAGIWNWRVACSVLGLLPLLLALVVVIGKIDVGRKASPADDPGPADRRYLLRPLAFICLMGVFNGMTYRGLMTFLPAYFTTRVHLDWLPVGPYVIGGAMTTTILLLGIGGQLLGGTLADRLPREKLYTGIFLLGAPVLLSLRFLSDLPLILMAAFFAFLYFANQPVGNALVPRYAAPGIRGSIYGLFFFTGFGAGSIMSPVAGWVGERFALENIFLLLSGTLGLAGLLGLWLTRAAARGGLEDVGDGPPT